MVSHTSRTVPLLKINLNNKQATGERSREIIESVQGNGWRGGGKAHTSFSSQVCLYYYFSDRPQHINLFPKWSGLRGSMGRCLPLSTTTRGWAASATRACSHPFHTSGPLPLSNLSWMGQIIRWTKQHCCSTNTGKPHPNPRYILGPTWQQWPDWLRKVKLLGFILR